MPDYKVLIADDEKLAREAIKLQLKKHDDVEIVAECTNGEETLHQVTTLKPDIIFLDIQMPRLNGLEVLEKLTEEYSPSVVFVTAFDHYALQAFENDAIDYLVKPFTDQRFEKAFQKAVRYNQSTKSEQQPTNNNLKELKRLLQQLAVEDEKLTISIRDGGQVTLVQLQDVKWIEATGNYVTIVTKEKKYLHKETLQTLEDTLPHSFVRIHKSTIVNTAYIKEFHSLFNGDYLVKLKDGEELRLSRNYKNRIGHLLQ